MKFIDHRSSKRKEADVGDVLIVKGGIPFEEHRLLVVEHQNSVGVVLLDLGTSKIVAFEDNIEKAINSLRETMRGFTYINIIKSSRVSVHVDYMDEGPICCSI